MTPAEITKLRQSYTKVKHMAPRMAKYFYTRANELDASLDLLFEEDKKNNGAAFVALLEKAVNSLEDPSALSFEIKNTEAKLEYYNLKKDCLNTIGVVFIDTLSFGFGNDFTQDVIDPWVKAYKAYAALFFAE